MQQALETLKYLRE